MPSHPKSYMNRQRLHSPVWGWMWWLNPTCWWGAVAPGLMIQDAYTEMCNSNKNVAIVMRNSMVYPQTPKKNIPVVRVVAANQVPELQVWPAVIDTLDEAQGIQTQKLTAGQRQEKLFKKLDLSSLASWSPELVDSTHSLLAEYYNIFSLESCELGCTHSIKHVIKVTNDAPFKEWFRQIPLLLVEEVCKHLLKMLDSGVFHPARACGVCCGIGLEEGQESTFLQRPLPS